MYHLQKLLFIAFVNMCAGLSGQSLQETSDAGSIGNQVKKPDYPKAIDYFFSSYYPGEKYEILSLTDSDGLKYFYAPLPDTLWFNKEGRYTRVTGRSKTSVSETDLKFMTSTAAEQILDVTLAQLATVNATSPEVKNLAASRTTNNFELHHQLKELSAKKHVHLPTELNLKQQKVLAEFNSIQGEEFDRAYTKYLVKADKKNTAMLRKIIRKAEDPEIKGWANISKNLSEENTRLAKQAYCSVK